MSLHMLSDTGANGKDTVDIHAHTSGSRAEYAAGKRIAIVCAAFLLALSLASAFPTGGMAAGQEQKPITLKTMGSLLFGGTVIERENGDTFHGDHGYAQFYIPQKARNYPLILWHGMGQSGRSCCRPCAACGCGTGCLLSLPRSLLCCPPIAAVSRKGGSGSFRVPPHTRYGGRCAYAAWCACSR